MFTKMTTRFHRSATRLQCRLAAHYSSQEACTAAREAFVLPRARIAVSMSIGLGNHGGDGRASLLFFFDYSIISGRFGANGSVYFTLSHVASGLEARSTRMCHVTRGILETALSLEKKMRAALLQSSLTPLPRVTLSHARQRCMSRGSGAAGRKNGRAHRHLRFSRIRPDLRGDLSCHTCM